MGNKRERKPTHPGELIREDLLPELGMSQNQLARLIGVSPRAVSDIINERRRVTPDLAFRLARVFNSTPEMWLNMQQAVDLWETQAVHGPEYERIQPVRDMTAVSSLPAQ
jgi:addiction module HigA family antidote